MQPRIKNDLKAIMAKVIFLSSFLFLISFSLNAKEGESFDHKFFQSFLDYLHKEYIEEVNDKKIMEYAINGILTSLDPHSAYLDKKSYNEIKINTKGEFGGIGLEFNMEKGALKVISPYEDTPAFKAGLKPQDLIVAIDGQIVKGMTLTEAGEKMRGPPGSRVKLKVLRESVESLELKITREIIKIRSVKSKLVGNGSIAYIKIRIFNDKVASAVRKEYDKIMKESPDIIGLIIDLRWNPGGIFDQGREVADLFLSEGDIVSIKGHNPKFNKIFKSSPEDISSQLPIAVLINGGSASASEIVAGALQDNRRALVVGTNSFGKGSIQQVIPLKNGGAIKLTTALYYTPSGVAIQAQGIIPDIIAPEAIVTPIDQGMTQSVSEASLRGHIKKNGEQKKSSNNNTDNKITFNSLVNLEENQDFQLLRAIDIVKSMALYSDFIGSNKQ